MVLDLNAEEEAVETAKVPIAGTTFKPTEEVVSLVTTHTGLLVNEAPNVMVQVLDALFPVTMRPIPLEPTTDALAPQLLAVIASTDVLLETIGLLKVCIPVHVFAVDVETLLNAAHVEAPAAEMVVTALPAAHAEAPPYAPKLPLAAESTRAAPIEVTERLEVETLLGKI